ncbi:MAG: nickel transporter, partial [Vulcanimicrobiaceae bacterium]
MKLFSTATFIVLSALLAAPAFAHPLGNFTINHLSELAVRPDRVTVRYVLDLAEIPTYAVMREASASA